MIDYTPLIERVANVIKPNTLNEKDATISAKLATKEVLLWLRTIYYESRSYDNGKWHLLHGDIDSINDILRILNQELQDD